MSAPVRVLLRLVAGATVAVAAGAGCGGDDDASPTTTAFEIGSPATILASTPTSVFPSVATIAPVTADTVDVPVTPFETSDVPFVPPDTSDAPVMISVLVGEEGNGPDRIEVVPLGALVSISILNDDEADTYHLHGYDLGADEPHVAGEFATITFTADQAGDFVLESHISNDVLLTLRVQ